MFIGAFKCSFNQHDGYQHESGMFAGGEQREWVSHVKVLKNKWSDGVAARVDGGRNNERGGGL